MSAPLPFSIHSSGKQAIICTLKATLILWLSLVAVLTLGQIRGYGFVSALSLAFGILTFHYYYFVPRVRLTKEHIFIGLSRYKRDSVCTTKSGYYQSKPDKEGLLVIASTGLTAAKVELPPQKETQVNQVLEALSLEVKTSSLPIHLQIRQLIGEGCLGVLGGFFFSYLAFLAFGFVNTVNQIAVVEPAHYYLENIYDEKPANALTVKFYGNSLLGQHQIPSLVAKLGKSQGKDIWFKADLLAGASTSEHHLPAMKEDTHQCFDSPEVVIVQPHSLLLAESKGNRQALKNFVEASSASSKRTIIMTPWARDDRKPGWYWNFDWSGGDSKGLLQNLEKATSAAANSAAEVSPVGRAWLLAHKTEDAPELYHADGNHATAAGATLTALVLYGSLYDLSAVEALEANALSGDVTSEDFETLKKYAIEALSKE